ncbi:integral membrane protein [Rickettsiales bacterium Ac37b]|nr:integral membrane protein [Rickettsiales bacterium Ac37b]
MHFFREHMINTIFGIVFVSLFAGSAIYLAELPIMVNLGISPLVIAIILGIIYGNTIHSKVSIKWITGIEFSAKQLLRLGIILYGFRVSLQQIALIGVEGLLLDIFVVSFILAIGVLIGIKLFKLDRHLAILIASGSAICGAAAVLAVESVLKSETYKSSVAVGTVVIFGTIAMFLFPLLQHTSIFSLTTYQFGIFAGASIHEVAQVVVAGNQVSQDAANIAIIVKMTRVLLLIPILILLSMYENKSSNITGIKNPKLIIPWFAVTFAMVVCFNSLYLLPENVEILIHRFDLFLMTMAMAAIGIETNIKKIKTVGLRPLYFAITLFFLLGVGSYSIVKVIF